MNLRLDVTDVHNLPGEKAVRTSKARVHPEEVSMTNLTDTPSIGERKIIQRENSLTILEEGRIFVGPSEFYLTPRDADATY